MTSYVDVDFYKNNYLLGRKEVVPFSEFEFWGRKASTYIAERTQGRVKTEEVNRIITKKTEEGKTDIEITIEIAELEEVKMATCEIAETYFNNEQASQLDAKRSESVGGYSVSYVDPTDVTSGLTSTLRRILFRWLGNTDLLYRGV